MDIKSEVLNHILGNSDRLGLLDLTAVVAGIASERIFPLFNNVAVELGAKLLINDTKAVFIEVEDLERRKLLNHLEHTYRIDLRHHLEVLYSFEDLSQKYHDQPEVYKQVLEILKEPEVVEKLLECKTTDDKDEALRYIFLKKIRDQLEGIHVLKTTNSIKIKSHRLKLEQMTDLMRNSVIFNERAESIKVLELIHGLTTVLINNPINVGEISCHWKIDPENIKYVYLPEGYSDFKLVYHLDIPYTEKGGLKTQTIFFEIQINTEKYIEAKKLETPLFDKRKENVNALKYFLNLPENIKSALSPKRLTPIINSILKEEIFVYNEIDEICSCENLQLTLPKIIQIIRIAYPDSNTTKDNITNEQLQSIVRLLLQFATLTKQSQAIYRNLNGVINSNKDGNKLRYEVLKLSSIREILSVSSHIYRRTSKKPRQLQRGGKSKNLSLD